MGHFSRESRLLTARARRVILSLLVAVVSVAWGASPAVCQERPPQRIPRQEGITTAALQGIVRTAAAEQAAATDPASTLPVPGATVTLRDAATGFTRTTRTNANGIFRVRDLPPGIYTLSAAHQQFEPLERTGIELTAGEVVTVEIALRSLAAAALPPTRLPRPREGRAGAAPPPPPESSYRELRRRVETDPAAMAADDLPPEDLVFIQRANRWALEMPEYDRYGREGEYPYVRGHRFDPFNINRLKGDKPIIGQRTFFNFTGTLDSLYVGSRVPLPSAASAARPGSEEFFGRGEFFLAVQNIRLAMDLFHGDTAFRPFDWRVRVTPTINVNYINTQERGIINVDVTRGTDRLDYQLTLQEAFVEVKLADLSSNYDFLSVRAGIQPFTSDFRGFLFFDEQPGVRLFGNLHSNKWEYNAAYFYLLEKDTNSVLNKFQRRGQQVFVLNWYLQDFLTLGYTTQFSFHYNKDDAAFHFDTNNFLVRPAPIGVFTPHDVRALYLGWTGNGHISRLNVSHAFYQAFGEDDLNPIADRPVTINAQYAIAELSIDYDWLRLKSSFLYASGDADPRDGRARGFDAIVEFPVFAGGPFSLWNREGIRLTGTGVGLVQPNGILPSLRTNKDEGQANFVNPGLWLVNAGADIELTPKLRSFVNVNYLRFDRTESLELLLFQAPIRHAIGLDYSLGFQYRPKLSENILLFGGVSALSPGQGFRDIYTGKTLFSVFTNVRFQF